MYVVQLLSYFVNCVFMCHVIVFIVHCVYIAFFINLFLVIVSCHTFVEYYLRHMKQQFSGILCSFISNLTMHNMSVPDSHCAETEGEGYSCPNGLVCKKLDLPPEIMGFNGFDNLGQYVDYFIEVVHWNAQ